MNKEKKQSAIVSAPLPGREGQGESPFDERIVRRGTNCVKWDSPYHSAGEPPLLGRSGGAIPLWVADMDFRVAPAIQQAIERRAAHGVFGYTHVPEAYYDAIISWFKRRHQWEIEREDILYTTGVVPAISCCLKAITMPGEKVLVLSPVYNCFFSSIRNNGCEVVEMPLESVECRTESVEFATALESSASGTAVANSTLYTLHSTLNWQDFEAKCAEEKTTAFLLCNPHNPGGRVWRREELEHMNDICQRHGVRIISDEIHCELVMPGYKFVPFGTISKDAVICNSPSKAFNIAGLQTANIICHDPELRRRINRAININEVCDLNPFGVEALMAAYNESEEWLDELCLYLKGNYDALCRFFAEELPQFKVMPLEGTYLAWVDIRATGMSSDELADRLYQEAGVWVSSGTMYSPNWGEGFIRINMACPRSQLMEGLLRMKKMLHKSPKFLAELSGEAERGD